MMTVTYEDFELTTLKAMKHFRANTGREGLRLAIDNELAGLLSGSQQDDEFYYKMQEMVEITNAGAEIYARHTDATPRMVFRAAQLSLAPIDIAIGNATGITAVAASFEEQQDALRQQDAGMLAMQADYDETVRDASCRGQL